MDMIQNNSVINLKKGKIGMWDKYRHESKQTICIIGVLILATKLCKADGHFSITEEEAILKIIPHDPKDKRILYRIMDEAGEDDKPIDYDALRLKKLIGDDHGDFLEFIIAVLYQLAHIDHVYSEEEDRDIKKVAKIFGLEETFLQSIKRKTLLFFKNLKRKNDNEN
tara:strand:- start:43 stop:543 length:501 start_codon:yes stop_codon:yes gene_type:complete